MSTVLVNGGAGYIGSHAVKALRAAGHTVVVFDNLSAGHAAAVGDATLVEGDVRLNVRAAGDLRKMFQFVHELRQNPRLRVLRLARGAHQDIAIWLGLREQVPLKDLLSAMNCVTEVKISGGEDQAANKTFDIALSA